MRPTSRPLYRTSAAFLCLALLLTACGNDAATDERTDEPTETATAPTPRDTAATAATTTGRTLLPWVDNLNLRQQPSTTAAVVTRVARRAPLTATGERSAAPETIVLRGVAYTDHWVEVTTAAGERGWLFGGAVHEEGRPKGNAPLTAETFEFPAFGRFDLRKWEREPATQEAGGDAESTTQVYRRDDQVLEIRQTEMGEYGYQRTHRLLDARGNLQKVREFEFATDPPFTLTETVTDYVSSPPVRYRRTQSLDRHYAQLNARPEMATGAWTTEVIDGLPAN